VFSVSGATGNVTFSIGQAVETTSNVTFGTVTTTGNVIVGGNLTVNGSTTVVNSTTTQLDDPIITLGGDTAPTVDDDKDRGIEFRWHNGTTAKVGFFGYDDSTGYFTFIPDANKHQRSIFRYKRYIRCNSHYRKCRNGYCIANI